MPRRNLSPLPTQTTDNTVLAVTLAGEYLSPQVVYKGKTERCHPKVAAPKGWDIRHTKSHWSNKETIIQYINKITVPFITQKHKVLYLDDSQPALAIFDCFRGQTTPDVLNLLEEHNIAVVMVPAYCTDKLRPLDVSTNKPLKHEMKKRFQGWYAEEVRKQIMDGVAVDDVRVDLAAAVIKAKSATWMISSWQALEKRTEITINGFQKAGILDSVTAVTSN